MGISTIQSYRGAQIFEAIGLDKEFVDRYFTWTASRIGGVGIDMAARETLLRHQRAFPDRPVGAAELDWGGEYQWRRDGEYHLFNPETVFKLQHASRSGQYGVFKEYTALVDAQNTNHATLRGLFEFKWAREAVRSRRWSPSSPSSVASPRAPCPTAPSASRPTRRSPSP
jgi:glutamate synthase domain-containing protein 2